jgi:hypothetical protein
MLKKHPVELQNSAGIIFPGDFVVVKDAFLITGAFRNITREVRKQHLMLMLFSIDREELLQKPRIYWLKWAGIWQEKRTVTPPNRSEYDSVTGKS